MQSVNSSYIVSDKVSLPNVVFNFLAWILTDEDNAVEDDTRRVDVTEEQSYRTILSLDQDLLFYISRGRLKTLKRVALSMSVKNLTGSREVITLLN